MDLLSFYGLFLAKTITIMIALTMLMLIIPTIKKRHNSRSGRLMLIRLDKYYHEVQNKIHLEQMNPLQQKLWKKEHKKKEQKEAKYTKKQTKLVQNKKKPTLYVINFKGSMDAREVSSLRKEVSAIVSAAETGDEVLLRLESPGGVVHGYGLAASQLQRLRKNGITLIISVDKIATSGGYMMACVANCIIAAPFALVGSIGVVGQIPNFHRFLKHNKIDLELYTAGEYKRTLTLFGENTAEGREKFRDNLNQTHILFKQFVHQMRPKLYIDQVANGEYWYGTQALEKGLIDIISTSDDWIMEKISTHQVIEVRYLYSKSMLDRLNHKISYSISKLLERIIAQ
ncbi:Probable protease SohB [Candidatus Erwinia haradaeae]|uniref:Probable protease SohB n=1 Tax=Candidatus Erwinia haradaeae TaxID=1922217 RepID=A0A451DCN2_9GAMM|nr:protease SohB [Candidatus Erwinia haradaeae]VFP84207.1 Probable protease SohB [Candidatus Erwinia haradaeae]